MNYDLREVCANFALRGDYVIGMPFGTGHINDTNAVTCDQGGTLVRYIVQRINTNVFRQPEQLMENFERVTSHLRGKLRRERETNPATRRRTLELVPAKDGRPFVRDAAGNFFRCYVFVENARTYDILETEKQAYEAAAAFGGFQSDLADLDGRLNETIPEFHNTVSRLAALENADIRFVLRQKEESISFLESQKRIAFSSWEMNAIKTLKMRAGEYAECLFMTPDTVPAVLQIRFDPFSRLLYSSRASDVARIETHMAKGFTVTEAISAVIHEESHHG